MLNKVKLLIASWIVELRIVKWANRVQGQRATYSEAYSAGNGWVLGSASIDGYIVGSVRS